MKKITKDSSIALVELPPTEFGVLGGELSKDEYSMLSFPPRATPILEAILKKEGYKNVKSTTNEKEIYKADCILVSSITRTSPQSLTLIENAKIYNPKIKIIVGGSDATYRSEEYLQKSRADIVVRGEGEKTLVELMKTLEKNPEDLESVDGIAFRNKSNIIQTKPRKLLTSDELGQLPLPYYNEEIIKNMRIAVMETSRGCPNNCEFCGVSQFYGRKYRTKPIGYVIQGLKEIKEMKKVLFYSDDNFAGNSKYTKALLEAMVDEKLYFKNSAVQVTVKTAYNQKLLDLFKKVKIRNLCVGIESIFDEDLREMKKPYTAKQNKEGIKILRDQGFWVHGMMIAGSDKDTPEKMQLTSEWANESVDSLQLFAITALPGTKLTKKMEEKDRILTKDYSLYDGLKVHIRPKNFTPFQLQMNIFDKYRSFFSFKNHAKRFKKSSKNRLYWTLLYYTQFMRGLHKTFNSPQTLAHLEFLKSIS